MDAAKLPRFKLVVGVDASDHADEVVEFALDQAARHERPELHLLQVVDAETEEALQTARQHLAAVVGSKLDTFVPDAERGDWRVRLHVRAGGAADEILALALEVAADLLVIGGHTEGRRHPHLGHTSSSVLASSPCPTLLVRVAEQESHDLATQQCPDCVRVRAESDGEVWFCDQHTGGYLSTSTLLMPHSESLMRGGPMW
jgi:nucleotide-binding universal stress UspA family protein